MHFFVEKVRDGSNMVSGDDFFHIIKSLRRKIGDNVTLVSIKNETYGVGKISNIGKRDLSVDIREIQNKPAMHGVSFVLYQAIPKKSKMEIILQKATELGVSKIVPVITEHIVPSSKKINKLRWNKIVKEASMQSRRFSMPDLYEPVMLRNIVNDDVELFCLAERLAEIELKQYLLEKIGNKKSIGVIVGAEGGFSDNELEMLKENGVKLVGFGNTILRTETAAIGVLSALRCFLM